MKNYGKGSSKGKGGHSGVEERNVMPPVDAFPGSKSPLTPADPEPTSGAKKGK